MSPSLPLCPLMLPSETWAGFLRKGVLVMVCVCRRLGWYLNSRLRIGL